MTQIVGGASNCSHYDGGGRVYIHRARTSRMAYLAAGRGQEAAAEFQKVLDRRGIVLADPIGALAHLQLDRAYVLSDDMAKAKLAY